MGSTGKGILAMCGGVFCMAAGDAVTKGLGADHSAVQIVFFRSLVSLPLVVLIAHRFGGIHKLSTRRPGVHLLRGLFATGSVYCFVIGLGMLPLADLTAIGFVAPLLVTLLSWPLLGERVATIPLVAVLLGFIGVLVVARPSGGLEPGVLVVLCAAACYAMTMITTRRYGLREYLWAMVFYALLMPFLVSLVLLPFFWTTPSLYALPGFALSGVLGIGAMLLLTLAFRQAPAALAAPFDYTALIWAVLFGWLFWNEVPDLIALAGTVLIIGSGLLVAYHDRRTSLKRRPSS
ncbi:DMT family transporter [Halotalea alkalilenta]|uniref:DMT family transporter n=1 Tax=Halotalea alkalilenta TaxID=376489 RepID=UPI00048654A0|nr:DMT family transporter [Halotalea alkalilenta]